MKYKFVKFFNEIKKTDVATCGGKGANLGEMTNAKIPVPAGFVVTANAYFEFIEKGSLKHKIKSEITNLDVNNDKDLQKASTNIQQAILKSSFPKNIEDEIIDAYKQLCGNKEHLVAVRSSATAEDLPDASFAGQQESYLNILGAKKVVESVHKCYASLFGARAIYYRNEQKFDHFKVGIAVPVQIMIQSEVSGIMFTLNPLSNNEKEISIEAVFGLGDAIVSGQLTPDQYLVDKANFKIKHKTIVSQDWQATISGHIKISPKFKKQQKLADNYVCELAKIGANIEKHYGRPQDIEWAFNSDRLYIVQSRPVTTLKIQTLDDTINIGNKDLILSGIPASPGVGMGHVKILKSAKDLGKILKGDILVAEMTDPDYVPAMKRAVAIVTDKGGRTSHASIVSRELGIPCVVGSEIATKILKENEIITVNGFKGQVYAGDKLSEFGSKGGEVEYIHKNEKTATKVYLNLASPDLAEDMSKKNVDGIGLLRAEFMIADIGKHPKAFISEGKQEEFIKKLEKGLLTFAESFNPRPVVYRATDFKTNEYRALKGGEKYEQVEENPLIGFRGAGRYVEDEDVFNLELEAIKRVRNKHGFKNLHLMIPFVRTVPELIAVKKIVNASGLRRSADFKLWMMVEIPSNVILLEEFINVGIDGVSIGSNDLAMLALGVDRDNEKIVKNYNELDPAVMWLLEKIVKTCAKNKITCSICGQAPSNYPELTQQLVNWGITSVSIAPDVIDKTRNIVFMAEHNKNK